MAHPIDIHVGKRIRFKRKLMHLTQTDLAKKLGITFQQVQKYEKGDNRTSASKLYEISEILEVSVSFFFEGYGVENNITVCKEEIDIINDLNVVDEEKRKKVYKVIKNTIELLKDDK